VNWKGVADAAEKLPRGIDEVHVKFSYGDKINAGKDKLSGKLNLKALGYKVNPQKVHSALLWLMEHNPLYHNVSINEDTMSSIREMCAQPKIPDIQQALDEIDEVTTRHTTCLSATPLTPTDVADILRREYGGGRSRRGPDLSQVPNNTVTIERGNEVCRGYEVDNLLGKVFPTMFPDGYSGNYRSYTRPLSNSEMLAHTSKLADPRFTRHTRYMFLMVNIKNMEAAYSSIGTALKGRIMKTKADGSTVDMTQDMFDELVKVVRYSYNNVVIET